MRRHDHRPRPQKHEEKLSKLRLPVVVSSEDVPLDDLVDVAAEPFWLGPGEGAEAAAEERVVAVGDDLREEKRKRKRKRKRERERRGGFEVEVDEEEKSNEEEDRSDVSLPRREGHLRASVCFTYCR